MTEETPSGVREFSVQLSCTGRGARIARVLAVEQLRRWEREFEDAQYVVGELAANAALHGRVPGRDMRLVLRDDGATLRIEVVDAQGDRLPVARAESWAESGRGLLLVAAYADRWGVLAGPGPCKTVWAELSMPCGRGGEGLPSGSGGAPPPGPTASRSNGGALRGAARPGSGVRDA
ncbi:ATP-binding protein [Streptomyces sp. Edi4]|uniref:ATP-binding protein n=1 Tax=Streptomyces sp. Edi4 TaxID=3162527 RepID=UPI003305ECBE